MTGADVILTGGLVISMDPRVPPATTVVIQEGVIRAVGGEELVAAWRGPRTEVIPLHGRTVLPGFTDSHIHLVEWAIQRQQVNLWGVSTLREALQRVRERHEQLPQGAWLRGGGWDASLWQDLDGPWPTAAHLDSIVPDRPVALDSKDLHALWVNTYTLRLAGITRYTPDPPGGVIVRDPRTGDPVGILKERARELVTRLFPPEDEATWARALEDALPALWAEGITAVHVLNDQPDMRNFKALQRLREEGKLQLRALLYIPAERQEEAIRLGVRSGFGDRYLRIGGVKYFADGTLGSRTAAMLEPYVGEPENLGVLVSDPEALLEGILQASRNGLAVAVHAIGDRANRLVLDTFQQVRREEANRGRPPLLHRVEHVQLLHPEDIPRLAELDLVASMQPIHATQDMLLAQRYWGDARSRWGYAWRSLLRHGTQVVFGSDAPVEQPSVIAGLHAALTRRRADGSPGEAGWIPEERVCLYQALHAYTLAPAVVEGAAAWRGSLFPGKVADLVVLDAHLPTVAHNDPMALLDVQVAMTLFEGRVVFAREAR